METLRDLSLETGRSFQSLAEEFGITDKAVLEYGKQVDVADMSSENFASTMNITNASVGAVGVGSKLAAVGIGILNAALSACAALLISAVITGLVNFVLNMKSAREEMEELAETAQQNIDDVKSKFDELNNTVQDNKKRYAELAQGINQITGQNVTLPTDDYKEFLDISNQLADLFPSLVKGYDENGNAILNLSGDVNTIVGALDDLVNAERKVAAQKILDNLPDIFKNSIAKMEDYEAEQDKLISEREKLYQVAKMTPAELSKGVSPYVGFDISGLDRKAQEDLKSKINSQLKSLNINGSASFDGGFLDIIGLNKADIEQNMGIIEEIINGALQNIQKDITVAGNNSTVELNNMKKNIFYLLEDLPEYYNQSNNQAFQNAMQQLLGNTDSWIKEMKKQLGDEFTSDDIQNWLQKNFLQGITNMSGEQQIQLADLFSTDVPDDKKIEIANQLQSYFDENDIKIKLDFILDPTKEGTLANTKQKIQNQVNQLSGMDTASPSEDSTKYAEAVNDRKKLMEFFDQNSIDTQAEYESWLKATEGCKSVDEAIRAYLDAKQQTDSDASQTDTPTMTDQQKTSIDNFQSQMQQFKEVLSTPNLDSNTLIDLMENFPSVDWESYTSGAKSLEQVLAEFSQVTLQSLIQQCPQLATLLQQIFNETFPSATGQVRSLIDVLDELQPKFDALQTAYEEMSDKDYTALSPNTLSSMQDTFGDLDSWDDFYNAVTSGNSTVSEQKELLSELCGEFVEESGLLDTLTDENADYITKVLEANGVTNAAAIVHDELASRLEIAKEALEELKNAHLEAAYSAEDLQNMTVDELSALYAEAESSGQTCDALWSLLQAKLNANGATIMTDGDQNNLEALMQKLGITQDETGAYAVEKDNSNNSVINTSGDQQNVSDLFNALGYTITQVGDYIVAINNASGDVIKTDGSISNINDLINALNRLQQARINAAALATAAAGGDQYSREKAAQQHANGTKYSGGSYTYRPVSTVSGGGNRSNSGGGGHKYNYRPSSHNNSGGSGGNSRNGSGRSGNGGSGSRPNKGTNSSGSGSHGNNGSGSHASENQTEEDFDWIDILIQNQSDYIDKVKDRIQDRWSNRYRQTQYNKLISASNKQIKNLTEAQGAYEMKAAMSGLKSKYVKKIKNGSMNISTIKNDDLKKQIQEYQKWWDKAKDCEKEAQKLTDSIREYEDAINALKIEKLEQSVTYLKNANEELQNQIDLKNKLGETIDDKYYRWQIYNNNKEIEKLKEENALYKDLQFNLSKTSKLYQEYQDKINENNNSIYKLQQDSVEQQENIIKNRWKWFDSQIDRRKNLQDELSDIRKKLDSDMFYNDKGQLTDSGMTNIALIAMQIQNAKKTIEDYRVAITKLDKELQNGDITQQNYTDQVNDFLSKIRNESGTIDDLRDSLIDMYTSELSAKNNVLDEEIDKRKKALSAKKEYYDYNKTISQKNKDINAIKAQLTALSDVTSQAGLAKKALLEAQLAEAEDDLKDTKKDHQYDLISEGYDKMQSDAEDSMNKLLEDVKKNADTQVKIVNEMLDKIKDGYKDAYSYIKKLLEDSGIVLSSDGKYTVDKTGNSYTAKVLDNDAKSKVNNNGADSSAKTINTSPINENAKDKYEYHGTCKSIKLNKTNVTLGIGQTVKLKATIYPTNLEVIWASSNVKVATVSKHGKVTAKKKGSCIITASCGKKETTCKVTVTKKAPTQNNNSNNSSKPNNNSNNNKNNNSKSGNTKVNANEKVSNIKGTLKKGSKGNNVKILQRALNSLGFKDNNNKKLSVDGSFGDSTLQAVKKFQKKYKLSVDGSVGSKTKAKFKTLGYKNGTPSISKDGLYITNENGQELSLQKLNSGDYTFLNKGSKVFTHEMSENLWKLAQSDLLKLSQVSPMAPIINSNQLTPVQINYENMINIEGNANQDTVLDLKKMMPDIIKQTTATLCKEMKKIK